MTTVDQTSILAAIEDVLKAVSALETYESVVGIHTRNTTWRSLMDLVRHAVRKEQVAPGKIDKILIKTGFVDLRVGPHEDLIRVNPNQNPNQLSRSPGTPHRG